MEIQKTSMLETTEDYIDDVYYIINHTNPAIDLFMYGVGVLCALFILFMIMSGGRY